LPLGLFGFLFSICSLTLGTLLLCTFLGLPLMALGLLAARRIGSAHRACARELLGVTVEAPPHRASTGRGFFNWLSATLRDTAGWRAHAYLLAKFPLTVLAFATAVAFRIGGVVFLVSTLIQQPDQAVTSPNPNGFVPHSFVQYGDFRFDSWPKLGLLALQGIVMILLSPWVLRPILLLDQLFTRLLLGLPELTERVRDLEVSRAAAVDDSATRLRKIERDLHDGAQAQLVAVAMKLSLASEKLSSGGAGLDVGRVRELVDTAHATARSAIVDLRDIVSGIHPPILNDGLAAALATFAARSPVPTELAVELPTRPSPGIETIAYFCAAELLTNVAKHSGAQHASLALTMPGDILLLRVTDDGTGGAAIGGGSGLRGLAGRAKTVDGTLSIDSPSGGPTTVTVRLPMHA
jgi:signal transduction histidine kinase